MTLFILADDLTGAADSAARCHVAGLTAQVQLIASPRPLPTGAVAFSTDSRYLPALEAAAHVRDLLIAFVATAHAQSRGVQWYKKIDSTLRGNIGAELDAMLTVLTPVDRQPCAVICPAFPAQGRGLVDGYLAYAQIPPHTLHLPTILAKQTARPMTTIALADVRAGASHLAALLLQTQQQGVQLFVIDALTDNDLATLLAATQQALPQVLFCGSAGLIEPLAREHAKQFPKLLAEGAQSTAIRKPMLAVIGSGSGMTHRQLELLRQRTAIRCLELQPDSPNAMVASDGGLSGVDCVLHLPQPSAGALLEGPAARAFAEKLTQIAVEWIHHLQPQTLLVVGGDTAVHLLHQLGIEQLTIVKEVMPGIPLSVASDALGNQWRIITKAGNFGDEETLIRLFEAV